MTINELCRQAHENAVAHGFYDKELETGTLLMLIVSELGEALEADRKKRHTTMNVKMLLETDFPDGQKWAFPLIFGKEIKDTFEDELADAIIRICDLAGYMKIDLESHVKAKMLYNRTRERLHGKEY